YHGPFCLCVCAGRWLTGKCFCHLRHSESKVSSDPSNAAYGPPWRHMEAPGICCLRTQQ
ncbi:hypothetical protein M9458_017593, partial [Cirrhinus mrigala]